MNDFIKAAIISILLFIFHGICVFAFGSLNASAIKAFKGAVGALVYALIYASWAYYLFSFIYLKSIKRINSRFGKAGIALILMGVAYFLFRTGDIIDGDFINRFQLVPMIVFLLTAPVMVTIASSLGNKKLRNN